ncbi:MAG: sulfatase-like hydrolase/transferase [Candidatus Latescibacter sp.]|nr:sulfatase-like hydrolase/transferase [Candidatus Latescibacter sp.]
MRHSYFRMFILEDIGIYLISILFEISFILTLITLFRRSLVPCYIFSLVYLFSIIGSYAFYMLCRAMPGVNTFSYMFLDTRDFFKITGDGLNIWTLGILAAFFIAAWFLLKKFLSGFILPSRKIIVAFSFLVLVSGLVLNNNVALKDNRTMPFSNCLFSLINGYGDFKKGKLANFRLMHRNILLKKPDVQKDPEFNILVFINESLSAHYWKEYGSGLNPTPHISGFIEQNKNNTFVFPRAFCNSTITKVSVSYLTAGLNPIQGRYELGKSPLFYEILKNNLKSYRTGLITTWSYKQANYIDFVSSPYLDYLKCFENIPGKTVCNLSADDSLNTVNFDDFLSEVEPGEKFCAILHYGNTHFPYFSKPRNKVFTMQNRMFAEYLNAVHNLDDNISGVLEILRNQRLLDNTVIIFTSDHGEIFGEVDKTSGHLGKYSFYTTEIPFWIYVPEPVLARHPEFREKLQANLKNNVCNNDIFPTILAFYGFQSAPENRLGTSLLADIDNGRDIFIFNGTKENRTDNRDYVGVIRNNDFFIVENQINSAVYFRYDLSDLLETTNLWGTAPEKDRELLASLRRENLDTFIKEPTESQKLFTALLENQKIETFLKMKWNWKY